MGQYYIIYNLTKKQSVKPAVANWKLGEWEWSVIIEKMGWDHKDQIIACGDYGDVVEYCWEPSSSLEGIEFNMKYFCTRTGCVLDSPVDSDD